MSLISQSDEDAGVGQAVADASGFEACTSRMEIAQPLHSTRGLPLPVAPTQGKEAPGLASVLKCHIQPAFVKIGIRGVGWHTFRHTVGTMLAEMGEHQLTIRNYLRHSNLHVTNKYLQATSQSKRVRAGEVGGGDLAGWSPIGNQNNNDPMSGSNDVAQFRDAARADWTQTDRDSVCDSCKCLKRWRGRRASNPRPLP
jgi:hypothetical protein